MPIDDTLRPAVRELQIKLERHQKEVAETKKAINLLHTMMGLPAAYPDNEAEKQNGLMIAPDQFFKKSIAVAAREYMQSKGAAVTVDELVDVLRRGGCSLGGNPVKNVRISLTKNGRIFVAINDDTFGLWAKYGGRPRGAETKKTEDASIAGAADQDQSGGVDEPPLEEDDSASSAQKAEDPA